MAGITRRKGVSYAALTPNMRGYQRAKAAGVDEIAIFGSASEGFSMANLNATIGDSLAQFAPVAIAAAEDGIAVRGYVSCVVDCPFDGPTPPDAVAQIVAALRGLGCYEVSLGDTIGHGTPESVARMLEAVLDVAPAEELAGHFHDTAGRALENVEVALGLGVRVFDAAVGGLGGCPYAPGAAGNVATEVLAARLESLGHQTGLNHDVIAKAAAMARAMR
jgi:hydroxymethylglutaryl-CoA lyase